ncbi:MAG: hypothetical protein R3F29_11180 [Planctomycetota bacterium]
MRFGPSHAALLVGAFSVALLTAPLSAQKAQKEPAAGLEFKPPKGWLEVPAGGDRGATVRLYCAPRAAASKSGVIMPLLRVMHFAGGDASNDVVDGLPRTTPFRGLEDFLQRNYLAKDITREAVKVGGVEGQRMIAKGLTLERAVVGIRVPVGNGEAAVCFEIPELQLDKMKKEMEGTLSSLAVIDFVAATPQLPPQHDAEAWSKLDEAGRKAARRKWAEAVVAAAEPGEGFKAYKSKQWTVFSAADAGFTKKSIAAAETARAWLEKKLPELAKDAPMPAVLRIFANPEQFAGFQSTGRNTREYDGDRRELYFVEDRNLGGNTGYGQLFRAVLWQMFDDLDPHTLAAMPRWFDNGLWEFLRSSKCDGKKLEFFAGDVEKGRIEHYLRESNNAPLPPVWKLMQEAIQPSPDDGTMEKNWGYTPDCARLIRWFWMDDGQQAFGKPTLVFDIVRALGQAHAKVGPDPTIDVPLVGLSEAQTKDRNTRYYKWRDSLMTEINNIATPLQPAQWTELDPKWLEYNTKFK